MSAGLNNTAAAFLAIPADGSTALSLSSEPQQQGGALPPLPRLGRSHSVDAGGLAKAVAVRLGASLSYRPSAGGGGGTPVVPRTLGGVLDRPAALLSKLPTPTNSYKAE